MTRSMALKQAEKNIQAKLEKQWDRDTAKFIDASIFNVQPIDFDQTFFLDASGMRAKPN